MVTNSEKGVHHESTHIFCALHLCHLLVTTEKEVLHEATHFAHYIYVIVSYNQSKQKNLTSAFVIISVPIFVI